MHLDRSKLVPHLAPSVHVDASIQAVKSSGDKNNRTRARGRCAASVKDIRSGGMQVSSGHIVLCNYNNATYSLAKYTLFHPKWPCALVFLSYCSSSTPSCAYSVLV